MLAKVLSELAKGRFGYRTGQTLIGGMVELHLEIMVDRLPRQLNNIAANVGVP